MPLYSRRFGSTPKLVLKVAHLAAGICVWLLALSILFKIMFPQCWAYTRALQRQKSISPLFPGPEECGYAPVIWIPGSLGVGVSWGIAGPKCRDLTFDESRQCRRCAGVLISRHIKFMLYSNNKGKAQPAHLYSLISSCFVAQISMPVGIVNMVAKPKHRFTY